MRTVATHHKIASIILFPSSFFCFLHVADVDAVKIQAEAERKLQVPFVAHCWCEKMHRDVNCHRIGLSNIYHITNDLHILPKTAGFLFLA